MEYFQLESKQLIEIFSFSFPQCKDLDRSKIAEKALNVDLFRNSNSCFTIKTGRILPLVSFSKDFFLCKSIRKKTHFLKCLPPKC